MVELEGCVLTEGAVLTVKVAALEVAAGVHVPETMHLYWYPFIVELTAVIEYVEEVALAILFHAVVYSCHW